jgi:hypothetical protein
MNFIRASIPFLTAVLVSNAHAQVLDSALHTVDCHPVAPGTAPAAMGCTIVGERTMARLPRQPVFWYLVAFPTRAEAEAAAGTAGLAANADGRYWVYSIAPRGKGPRGGEQVARVGPLSLPRRAPFVLTAAFAVLPPGASSLIHTHAGPEAWYMLAGEQCLETPDGIKKAGARHTMTQRGYTPMQLFVTGKETRKALFIVLHDSASSFAIPSAWRPTGRCKTP